MTFPDVILRPGAATSPQPKPGVTQSGTSEPYHLQFLAAEERSTALLMSYFQDARFELEAFIREGDLTVSDATFYRNLLDETNRIASQVNAQGAQWTSGVIPAGYSAAWRTHSSLVVPTAALEALSRSTLSLITQTSEGIRQSVRQTIAQGILQGLSGEDVRARILATGLTNIPHWPNVEYRAGVIARTETMNAYNAGALDSLTANGARFVRWIASPDEATCSICLPRDGKVYRISIGATDDLAIDPYPNAPVLDRPPAHPRCRCTIRAEYRGPDGQVIRQGIPDVDPTLPKDAMGGLDAPILPPAQGDLAKAFGGIGKDLEAWLSGSSEGASRQAFWRSLGRLSDDELRLMTHAMGARAGNVAFDSFLRMRYGIRWPKTVGWTPELKLSTLRALERVREKWPRFVVDSRYLHTIGEGPQGKKRFGSNTIARAFVSGEVEGNMKLWQTYTGANAKGLRAGPGVDAAEEVILHEIMHTIHYRYGLYDGNLNSRLGFNPQRNPWQAVEAVGREWHEEYQAIRKTSHGVAPDEGAIAKLREQVIDARVRVNDPARAYARSYNQDVLDRLERELAAARAAVAGESAGEWYPTRYAMENYAEDFAEAAMLYFLNPARLKKFSPARYEFLRTKVFVE